LQAPREQLQQLVRADNTKLEREVADGRIKKKTASSTGSAASWRSWWDRSSGGGGGGSGGSGGGGAAGGSLFDQPGSGFGGGFVPRYGM
jgi:hypothetical protein